MLKLLLQLNDLNDYNYNVKTMNDMTISCLWYGYNKNKKIQLLTVYHIQTQAVRGKVETEETKITCIQTMDCTKHSTNPRASLFNQKHNKKT